MKDHSAWKEIVCRLMPPRVRLRGVVGIVVLSTLCFAISAFCFQRSAKLVPTAENITSSQSVGASNDGKNLVVDDNSNAVDSVELRPASGAARKISNLLTVSLTFEEDSIMLDYLISGSRAWGKGEVVKPGHLSYWTGWSYPDLRDLGEGDHLITDKKCDLSVQQQITLRITP